MVLDASTENSQKDPVVQLEALAGVDSGAPAAQTKKDEPMGLENGLSA